MVRFAFGRGAREDVVVQEYGHEQEGGFATEVAQELGKIVGLQVLGVVENGTDLTVTGTWAESGNSTNVSFDVMQMRETRGQYQQIGRAVNLRGGSPEVKQRLKAAIESQTRLSAV